MTINEFFHMGGYALYVWLSYGLGLLVILINWIMPVFQRKTVLRELSAKMRREQRQ